MFTRIHYTGFAAAALGLLIALPPALQSQPARGNISAPTLIRESINENKLRTLRGNTRPEATAANDRGRVADNMPMEHMLLQLQRHPDQEQAARQFIDSLHDPSSPNFHKWMTASQFGQTYGLSPQDLETVNNWIQSHGFTVNSIAPSNMLVDFSGTAGQVRTAFHTEIHNLDVSGTRHVANMSDPQIPEALAPAVAGIMSLHDFKPRAMKSSHKDFTYNTDGTATQAVVPADLATIYNLNPLFAGGVTGQGQTIAVVEDSDLFDPNDWTIFQTTFGLTQYGGSLTTIHPGGCTDPGVPRGGDDGETIADAEWASAAAPGAAIQVAACADTLTTSGIQIAIQNLVNSSNPPSIISVSFGNCEAENGQTSNAGFNSIYQQAVAEGISVFVASGDGGAAACDAGNNAATHGIGVSAFASTPYNVAVGGTDFADSSLGTTNLYWGATNGATFGSALSYIPEIPWNDSCAGSILASYLGYQTSYGPTGFCSSSTAIDNSLVTVAAASGGPSGCATGISNTFDVTDGTCQGWLKPSWQAGVAGIPSDGVRDLPDVSLFAGDGIWGHYYVTCWTDTRNGGAPCTGDPSTWGGAGGTSFSSPILAGIQALVNQKYGPQGNPNYVYYKLAASASSAACNSSSGTATASNCIFYNITQGDIDVTCSGTQNCFGSTGGGGGFGRSASGANGALSLSNQAFTPAYASAGGWNFATGLGSINAANLVNNWSSGK